MCDSVRLLFFFFLLLSMHMYTEARATCSRDAQRARRAHLLTHS